MQVISTFKIGCPHLTLKEGPKVKPYHIKRFIAHDILQVGFTLQTSGINTYHFLVWLSSFDLEGGSQGQI